VSVAPPRPRPESRSTARAALVCLLAVALVWRLGLLAWSDFAIDADEAVVGLMAKHVAEGRELPVWYYGQPYMGALEAYCAAPLVALLGPRPVALKLTALAFALAFVGLAHALARRVLGRSAAVLTALYLAAPPLVLAVWSLKLRGGYTSLLALGQLILLLAHRVGTGGATPRASFGLGLAAGVASWLNLLAFPFVGAAGLYLLSRRAVLTERRALGACALGFALGSAPFWVDNLFSGGATFVHLFSGRNVDVDANVDAAFGVHLPQLLGAHAPWEALGDAAPWRLAVLVLFAAALTAFAVGEARSLKRFATASREPTSGAELYVLCALLYLAGALRVSFGDDPSARFAVVLYCALAPVFGRFAGALWDRGGAARGACVALTGGLLALHLGSLLEVDAERESTQHRGAYVGLGLPDPMPELVEHLVASGVEGVACDHWTGPRVVYQSGERVVTVPTRYAPHEEVYARCRRRAWILSPGGPDAERLTDLIGDPASLGLAVDERDVGGYRVLELVDAGLDARAWRAVGSGEADAGPAIDRNPRSKWRAGENSRPGQTLTVDLGSVQRVRSVGVLFSPEGKLGRVALETSVDGARWRRLADATPADPRWRVDFEPHGARFVRLVCGERAWRPWYVHELFAFPARDDG